MKGWSTAAAVAVLGVVASGCGSNTAPGGGGGGGGGLNNIGGYPLVANEVFSYLLVDPNSGLSYLEVVVADTPATAMCSVQMQSDSIDSAIANSTFALFDIYAPAGQALPVAPATYPVGTGAAVAFYRLDASCNSVVQAFANTGSVTLNSLDAQYNVSLSYTVDFANGYLQGTVTGAACVLSTGAGLPGCGVP
jgi:hypothetical protein